MKQIYFLLLLCSFSLIPKISQGQTYRDAKFYMEGIQIGFGYHQTAFINSQYGQLKENDVIKNRFGYVVNLRVTSLPLIIDFNFFVSSFKVENNPDPNWTFADTSKVRHAGMEVGLSLPIIPESKHFVPYLGLAYQNGFLGVNTDVLGSPLDDVAEEDVSVTKVTGILWKAGLMINMGRKLNLITEYKQSLNAKSEKATSQWSAVLSYRIDW